MHCWSPVQEAVTVINASHNCFNKQLGAVIRQKFSYLSDVMKMVINGLVSLTDMCVSLLFAIPQEWKTVLKQPMSSTVNWMHSTCNRKAHMQKNLQYLTQSLAPPSSNRREKTHWTWLYLSRKTKNLLTSFSCYKWGKIIRVSIWNSSEYSLYK